MLALLARSRHVFLLLVALQVLASRSAPLRPVKCSTPGASVSIVAGGDVLLDRGVRTQIQKHGARALFSGIAPILHSADFAFANLECPLARRAPKIARAPAFKANPNLAPELKKAGFDVLSQANNHALDCGQAGLGESLDALAQARLQVLGAGRTQSQALQPVVTRARGVRIAWLGASQFASPLLASQAARPSVAPLSEGSLCARVRAARRVADVVVVSVHWGIEYQVAPTPEQRHWAQAALAAGADIILGHHSHVLGPIEQVQLNGRRRLVAYSLGNLVFDSPLWNKPTNRSELLSIQVGREGLRSWKMIPLHITNCCPRPDGVTLKRLRHVQPKRVAQ